MNEIEANTLGLRIQAARKAAGLSQEALGEQLGVSRQAVSKWESDAAIPELENLIAMSRLFGVSVGVLLGVEQAEEAPSLSEQELQAAQAIAEKYAEQIKPAARPRWKALAAVVLVCAVIVGAVQWRANHRIADLNEQLITLQMQMNDIQNGVAGQLSSFTSQMHSLLEEQTSNVFNASSRITSYNAESNTVTVSLSATAREWNERTTGQFTATLGNGEVYLLDATCNNGVFSAEGWEMPRTEDGSFDAQFSITLWDNGVARSNSLDWINASPEDFRTNIYGSISPGRITFRNNLITVTEVSVTYEKGYSYSMDNSLTELDLCVFRNEETTPEQVIPLTEFMENVDSYISVTTSCSLGDDGLSVHISEGDTVLFALRTKDSFGNISYNLVDGRKLTTEKLLHLGFRWRDSLSTRWTPGDLSTYTFSNP